MSAPRRVCCGSSSRPSGPPMARTNGRPRERSCRAAAAMRRRAQSSRRRSSGREGRPYSSRTTIFTTRCGPRCAGTSRHRTLSLARSALEAARSRPRRIIRMARRRIGRRAVTMRRTVRVRRRARRRARRMRTTTRRTAPSRGYTTTTSFSRSIPSTARRPHRSNRHAPSSR